MHNRTPPPPTKCPQCGTWAAATVCPICKAERPFARVALHPALSHAQAQQVCKNIGARVAQDGRGNVHLEDAWGDRPQRPHGPVSPEAA